MVRWPHRKKVLSWDSLTNPDKDKWKRLDDWMDRLNHTVALTAVDSEGMIVL